jgi:hypothetical protein
MISFCLEFTLKGLGFCFQIPEYSNEIYKFYDLLNFNLNF